VAWHLSRSARREWREYPDRRGASWAGDRQPGNYFRARSRLGGNALPRTATRVPISSKPVSGPRDETGLEMIQQLGRRAPRLLPSRRLCVQVAAERVSRCGRERSRPDDAVVRLLLRAEKCPRVVQRAIDFRLAAGQHRESRESRAEGYERLRGACVGCLSYV
jgi:hypothetical protein